MKRRRRARGAHACTRLEDGGHTESTAVNGSEVASNVSSRRLRLGARTEDLWR